MLSDLLKKLKKSLASTNGIEVISALCLVVIGVLIPRFVIGGVDCRFYEFVCKGYNLLFGMTRALSVYPLRWTTATLNWVIEGGFLAQGVGYQPHNNPIIEAGWVPVRNFTNMFFIVGLIVIGIATAIRYKDYQAQKLLPKLLLVALLINFTPALAAGVINASDTAMNHFLAGAGIGGLTTVTEDLDVPDGSQANTLDGYVEGYISWAARQRDSREMYFGQAVFLTFFAWGTALILLMFALLFMVRYVILWLLIIVSPLAFFAYVFPGTREKIWDQWWEQFINWCIIGIPAAITLMLGTQILRQVGEMSAESGLDADTLGQGIVTFVVSFTLPLIFLAIGYLITLQVGAKGSEAIIKAGKTAGKNAPGLAVKGAGWATKKAMPERAKRRIEKMSKEKAPTKKEMKEMGTLKRTRAEVGKRIMPHALRREVGRRALGAVEAEAKEIDKAEKEAEGKSPERKLSEIRSPTTRRTTKIGDFRKSIEQKQLRILEKMGMTQKEMVKMGRQTLKASPEKFNEIAKALPHLTEEMGKGVSEETRKKAGLTMTPEEREDYGTLTQKIIAELSPGDIKKLSKETIKDEEVTEAIHKFWTGRELSAAAQQFGREFTDKFNREARAPKRGADWYVHENRPALNYLRGSAAQDLGFEVPPGRTLDESQIPRGPESPPEKPERPTIETPSPEAPRRKRVYPSREGGEEEKGSREWSNRRKTEREVASRYGGIEDYIRKLKERNPDRAAKIEKEYEKQREHYVPKRAAKRAMSAIHLKESKEMYNRLGGKEKRKELEEKQELETITKKEEELLSKLKRAANIMGRSLTRFQKGQEYGWRVEEEKGEEEE